MAALLIYDRDCPYCAGVAKLAQLLGRGTINTKPYQSEAVQDLLADTFDDPGFTLYLFDTDTATVYWGSAAARHTGKLLHLPTPVTWIVTRLYPYLVNLFSILSGRSGVRQPACTCNTCATERNSGGSQEISEEIVGVVELVNNR